MALTQETTIIKPIYENIPQDLKQLDRWVCWRAEERKGKITKVPYSPSGYPAKSNDNNTWSNFETVKKAFETNHFDGIGFMLGDGIIGIDIDSCIDEKGNVSDLARNIISSVDSYYEKSVSGSGVHIILKGELPEGYMSKNTKLDLEVYGGARYFTITGVTGQRKPVNNDQNGILTVLNQYFKKSSPKQNKHQKSSNLSNSELWEKMFNSKKGQAIKSLYDGHLINGDNSGTDQSLCNHLAFWTNKDPYRMDSMFRESGLMRDKWDEVHYSDGSTFGEGTIKKAIEDTGSTIGEYESHKSFSLIVNDERFTGKKSVRKSILSDLEINPNTGKIINNSRNAENIIKSELGDAIAFDVFKNSECVRGDLPWRKREFPNKPYEHWLPSDDKRLQHYMGKEYDFKNASMILNAYTEISRLHPFHPIKEYLESQVWDGIPRVETFFIDYLGATNSDYIKAVTRKWFAAAVTRIYDPGCKFDYMPVLVGPQGAKKSSTIARIALDWFSDSLKNFDSKDAGEQLQGSWIFEIGELAAMKKSEVEEIKAFITKQSDIYRVAYDRIVSDFPRKCVFIGTTNKMDFLRDQTGNRRFWAIEVNPDNREYDPAEALTNEIVGQIWAEAFLLYQCGEKLYLDDSLEEVARQIQENHMEEDPRKGLIQEYLEKPLPSHWDGMSIGERITYLYSPTGNIQRTKVCAAEIWAECLGNDHKNMKTHEAREICDIIRKTPGWQMLNNRKSFKHYGKQTAFEWTDKTDR
jgi:hypothetical protein